MSTPISSGFALRRWLRQDVFSGLPKACLPTTARLACPSGLSLPSVARLSWYLMQPDLFNEGRPLPHGLLYRENFVTPEEEAALLATIRTLPLSEARYRQYTARRRTINYGAAY